MNEKIAVVIPCYKVKNHILDVISLIGPEVSKIYIVDDCCPDGSGSLVLEFCKDERVVLLRHEENKGVGGAVMTGYRAAIQDDMAVLIKIDGDGQMDPGLIPIFAEPILNGSADYTKGNRFYDLTHIKQMPAIRLVGNAFLSFMSKFSTGYWDIFDPTNGYTAIHASVAAQLSFDKISQRYFFESDMLFQLNIMRCVVMDVPMDARYADEQSSLRIKDIFFEFLGKHIYNFNMRIFYNYFLRDLSAASFELVFGLLLTSFGLGFGIWNWWHSANVNSATAAGTVMLAAMPLLMGVQLLLAFLSSDIQSVPKQVIHSRLQLKTRFVKRFKR